MRRNVVSVLLVIVIAMAVLGMVSNIQSFFTTVLWSGLIIAAVYFIYRYASRNRPSNKIQRKYDQAVKQSQQKYKKKPADTPQPIKTPRPRRDNHGLVVIEGKKNKRKKPMNM
ncbi:MAG: SA1362 family protein [Bacilli bacterium]